MLRPEYSRWIRSIPWCLMPWRQPWNSPRRVNGSSSTFLRLLGVEKWFETQMCLFFLKHKFSMTSLNAVPVQMAFSCSCTIMELPHVGKQLAEKHLGPISQRFHEFITQISWKFGLLLLKNNDQIWSQICMSWQLSCHDMCKIVAWSDH